jgi:hypothetical protein
MGTGNKAKVAGPWKGPLVPDSVEVFTSTFHIFLVWCGIKADRISRFALSASFLMFFQYVIHRPTLRFDDMMD